MDKKSALILGAGALAGLAFLVYKALQKNNNYPLEKTLNHLMNQSLDHETYSVLSNVVAQLQSLPRKDAVLQAQMYLDGKLAIGNIGQIDEINEQPYRGLRIDPEGSVYISLDLSES